MSELIVSTTAGKVEGYRDFDGTLVWKGIPYAKPPVGDLRFRAPEPPEPWTEVRETKTFGATCPQVIVMQKEPQDEDCLYLNVYAPSSDTLGPNGEKATDGKPMPVLFFVHGGAFGGGSGSQYIYYGNSFVRHGIILVTFNYRLGVMGMFDFSELDKNFVSNIALRDQVAALKWVNENIAAFGGDPNDVTICGQSAGAISILSLLSVPSAKPYFSKAIAMSAFPDLIKTKEEGRKAAKAFLDYAHIETAEQLKQIDAMELTAKCKKFISSIDERFGLDYIMPTEDDDFLPKKPRKAVEDGSATFVPLMMGVTNNEVDILFRLPVVRRVAMREIKSILGSQSAIEQDILTHYRRGAIGHGRLGRDWLLRIPSEWYAEAYGEHADVWFYRFDYAPRALKLLGFNAMHCTDLIFAFKNFKNFFCKAVFALNFDMRPLNALGDRLQKDIADFVKSGKADWAQFKQNKTVKVYDLEEDAIESNGADDYRSLWERSEFHKIWKAKN